MPAAKTRAFATLVTLSLLAACTFSSTSSHWNRRVGGNGKAVYVKSHTNVGFNLLIAIPLLGATSLPAEIDYLTEEIADENGDTVRLVESASENYWYGFPPFTWILTPVITTVTADYEPDAAVLAEDRAEQEKELQEKAARKAKK